MRQYLTRFEVAERLGCSPRTVKAWIHTGKLRAWKPPGHHSTLRIDVDDLAEFIRQGAVDKRKAAPDEDTGAAKGEMVGHDHRTS